MRPADRVVGIGVAATPLVDVRHQELGGLQLRHAVEVDHLVEGAVEGPFGRGAVVADDVVDEGVVEDLGLLEQIDQAADLVVGVLEEPGVDLHLAAQERL